MQFLNNDTVWIFAYYGIEFSIFKKKPSDHKTLKYQMFRLYEYTKLIPL